MHRRISCCWKPGNHSGRNSTAFSLFLFDQTYLPQCLLNSLLLVKEKMRRYFFKLCRILYLDNIAKIWYAQKATVMMWKERIFRKRTDSLISKWLNDGQLFTTLNFRTYRYIKLLVHTQDEPSWPLKIFAFLFKQVIHFKTNSRFYYR